MKAYKIKGGGEAKGNDAHEIITDLFLKSREPDETLKSFMKQTARRCLLYSGSGVRTYSPQVFLEDLIKAEYMWEYEPDNIIKFQRRTD